MILSRQKIDPTGFIFDLLKEINPSKVRVLEMTLASGSTVHAPDPGNLASNEVVDIAIAT